MVNSQTKTRSYATNAYFAPNIEKENLHVLANAKVSKIHLEDDGSGNRVFRASGVVATVEDSQHTIVFRARKDIVLAAGTFQSPKLLELSGIGDADLLQTLGIPVVINNPNVGQNLQDHVMTGFSLEVNQGVPTISALQRQEPKAIESAMQMYTNFKAGPLAIGGIQSHAYMQLLETADSRKSTEQLFAKHVTSEKDKALLSIMDDPEEGSAGLFLMNCQANLKYFEEMGGFQEALPPPDDYLTLGAIQSHPFSRGTVHISSADPNKEPTIDPNYFSHPLDLEIYARHLQSLETIAETEPLASLIKKNGKRNHPRAYFKDLDAAKEYVLSTVTTAHHWVGSCAMMPREDGGVVSERLLVYGTNNLRVVDASVMPLIPRGNTCSSVYAVAERAADMIKEDHSQC